MENYIQELFDTFKAHRNINRTFFDLLEPKHYDYRMVSTEKITSNLPRENIARIIGVTRCYVDSLKSGELILSWRDNKDLYPSQDHAKAEFLDLWDQEVNGLESILVDETYKGLINTYWGESATFGILDVLKNHEILHIGINLTIMDHIGMERFNELIEMWGE